MRMRIKPEIEFVSFGDGRCRIWGPDAQSIKYDNLGFTNRVLGYKRSFAAAAAQVQTDRVIRIHQVPGVDNHDVVEIVGDGRYLVELVQQIYDSNPPSQDLTLRRWEMYGHD